MFLKFPHIHVVRTGFLKKVRTSTPQALLMMQIYLLLGAYRTFQTGQTRLTYDTMSTRLEVDRLAINEAVINLQARGLIRIYRPSKHVEHFHFKIIGTNADVRRVAEP